MTTDRIRSLDAVVQSRIQLAIQYTDLDRPQRLSINKNRLKDIPDDEIENREELMNNFETSSLINIKQSSEIPNRRQIRNIVTYARALALSEGKPMKLDHLIKIADITSAFMDSMKNLTQDRPKRNELPFNE
jgi:hypothetical protein